MQDNSEFGGLSLEDILPLKWEEANFDQSAAIEHANEDTARALQAIAVYEETPRSPSDDVVNKTNDGSRIEAKLDLLLSLVANLVDERTALPDPCPVIIRGRSIEWQSRSSNEPTRGTAGFVNIWANTHIPLPLRLPCRIVGGLERNGYDWIQASIEFLAPSVRDSLDQVIFRHHRRQIAIQRGTMVPSSRQSL